MTQEEPKYPIGGYAPGYYTCTCVTCKETFQGDKRAVQCELCAILTTKEEPKQETLEEAAERILDENEVGDGDMILSCTFPNTIKAMVEIAKWQSERMYSEEEVLKILYQFHYDLINSNFDTKEEWFEQFKKK